MGRNSNSETQDKFKEYLEPLLVSMKVKSVTTEDAERLQKQLEREIRKIDRARTGFTHEWTTIRARGRVVIPRTLRNALDLKEGTVLDCHIYPNTQKPRGILLIKER